MSSVNLESALNSVNKHFINIDANRKSYAHHFQTLKTQLFSKLQEDLVIKKLLNGHCLQGSYGDNLKVSLPDEFDSVFQLKLPFHDQAIITADVRVPGNVHIDLTEIFKKIQSQPQYTDVFKKLKEMVTPSNLLLVEKVQSWLQSCVKKALDKLGYAIVVNNESSTLSYSKTGPAHCIKVSGPYKYSVDFVPGFIFEKKQNIVKNVEGCWHAIPKPSKPLNQESISFRASYFDQEAKIMKEQQNLKNVLRMMKKFRDKHQNMANLKSYYIKTVFLWKTRTVESTFWKSPINEIVVEMFHDLERTLLKKNLPFFWNSHHNMYDAYNTRQIEDMYNCVKNATLTLYQAQNRKVLDELVLSRTFSIFLTKNEQEMIPLMKDQFGNLSLQSLQTTTQSKQQPPQQPQAKKKPKQAQQQQQQKLSRNKL